MIKHKNKIIHICSFDKFIKDFIEFNEEHCSEFEHEYFIIGYHAKYELPQSGSFRVIPPNYKEKAHFLLTLSRKLKTADKVIIHGLFDFKLIFFLYVHKKYLSKTCWVIWGGDLYIPPAKNIKQKTLALLRKSVVERLYGVVTYIKGDYINAKKNWNLKGKYFECIMYPSNIFKDQSCNDVIRNDGLVNILVGHSANPENFHDEVFEKLKDLPRSKYADIYVPLSYGDEENKKRVLQLGKFLFGEKFHPLTDFMKLSEYLSLLASIDIAVFNHKRQQAMGNTINLIGLGKTVYLRSDVTQWQLFNELGVTVLDIERFDGQLLTQEQQQKNKQIIKNYFSEENYISQLNKLYAAELS
ncbi:TDP-N-acetylfucosamine:lipid II N-acetylfucosaminyltransferase [Catenovulum sediminis]|uniref:TDP-N-acetylfucosamine:lipid II N-acetylfucosaminyltransferase n=1 Tax=Catenovulum sediminis TaxID=1740262 RepID=UPI00163D6905|nr:TDP-N-acetylfucosamine:lipid II N-acetylfucosaminyltransferase [Catenovulum sediminis]